MEIEGKNNRVGLHFHILSNNLLPQTGEHKHRFLLDNNITKLVKEGSESGRDHPNSLNIE